MAKKRRGVSRRRSAPKTKTIVRWRTRGASAPRKKRRGSSRRKRSSSAGTVAAAVGSAVAGAGIGAMANEAGLLLAVPTQNRTGISLVGWTGLGFIALGALVAKRETTKLLTYGLGGGLVTTELVRQIDNRGYDFEVAFGNAPALTYDPTPVRQLAPAEQAAAEAFNLSLLESLKRG